MAGTWTKLGAVCQNDKTGGFYIQLEDGVEITLKGKKVKPNVGKTGKASLALQDPKQSLQRMLDNGQAKDVDATKARIENLTNGKAKFVKFEIFSTGGNS